MKSTRYLLLAVVAALVTAPGCAQHGDMPAMYRFIPAPTPTNLDIADNNNGTYDITWDISDPIAVKEYRVYQYSLLENRFVVLETVTDRTAGISTGTGAPIGGIPIGISAVTVENVEGAMAIGVTPEPQ